MSDEEQDREEQGPRRPRVIDRRISARTASETSTGGAQPEAPTPPAPAPPPFEPAPSDPGPAEAAQADRAQPGQPAERVWTPEQEAEAQRIAREIVETPSLEWVVNAAVTLANVAATKLEMGAAADAQLAIDTLAGILSAVGSRLQQAESPLRQTLAQLQLAYAQRQSAPASPGVVHGEEGSG
jgi:hypothetical protein